MSASPAPGIDSAPRLLVLEPKWTGHYPMFAAMVADALRSVVGRVTLSLTTSTESETGGIPELAEDEVSNRIEVRRTLGPIPSGFSPLTEAGGSLEWTAIEKEIETLDPDLILIPSADAIACARETRSRLRQLGIPTSGCIHNARFGYPADGPRFLLRREWMRWRLRRSGMTLGTLDPVAVEAGRSIPLLPLPMPIPSRNEVGDPPLLLRELEDRLEDRRMILAIGEHSRRKATDRLLVAWPDPAPKEAVLVIAGRRSKEVDRALDDRRSDVENGHIIDIDRVLSTSEFHGLLERADVVTALYHGHVGISGVVVEAAARGTAVLGCADGGIGRMITMHGLGAVIQSDNPKELAQTLEDIAEEDPRVDESRRKAFNDSCHGQALGTAWGRLIDKSRGL